MNIKKDKKSFGDEINRREELEHFEIDTVLGKRRSNNNNKLIRRFIPKGMDISEISEGEIKRIEKCMNDYPRKLFN